MEFLPDEPRWINGRYQLLRLIGEGGMGRVFLAEDHGRARRHVALKMLRPDAVSSETIDGFRREFSAMADLRHPNLVEVHDFGTIEGSRRNFLTMEFVPGPSLRQVALPLSAPVLLRLLVPVCQALDFLHARGVVHQDVKPGNLLLTGPLEDGSTPGVKLADFGLAMAQGRGGSEELAGTPEFMAPERFLGGRVDGRSDLYSLGAVLFYLATGRVPYGDLDGARRIEAILGGPPPLPPGAPPLPEALGRLLHKLLDPSPGHRYPTAAAVVEAANRLGATDLELHTDATRRSLLAHAPLVGRRQELKRILDLFPGSGDEDERRPLVVVIEGEAGIGKSRLMHEVRVRGQLGGIDVVEGNFSDVAGGPLAPFPEILRRLTAAASNGAGEAEAPGGVLALLRRATAGDEAPGPSPASRHRLLSGLATGIASATHGRPTILLLEDLAGAGALGADVLRRLGLQSGRQPLLVLATLREGEGRGAPAEAALAALEEENRLARLLLTGLSAHEVRMLVGAMLGTDDPPPALVQQLVSHSGGNPFFVEECMRSLLSDGGLVRGPEGWRLEGKVLSRLRIPSSASEVIQRQLARLPEDERKLLEAVAVAGRPVEADELVAVSRWEPAAVDERLAELVLRGLLVEELEIATGGCTGRYQFRHALMRRTLLDGCPAGRLRQLHRRFARILTARPDAAEEDLAHHHAGAGDASGALPHLRAAAAEAEHLHAPEHAAEHYVRALDLLPEGRSELRSEIEESLGRVEERVGANQRAVEAYQRALAACPDPVDERREATLRERIGWNLSLAGEYEAARRDTLRALELFAHAGDRTGEAGARKNLGILLARQGETDGAQESLEIARTMFDELGDREGLASVLNNLALLRSFRGDGEGAAELFARALTLRDEMGDRRGRLGPLVNLAFARTRQGRAAEALPALQEAVSLAQELGDLQNEGNALMHQAEALRGLGRLDAALRSLQAALRVHQETGDIGRQINCHDSMGEVHRILGDVAVAAEHHQRALDLAGRLADPVQGAYALASLGLDELGLGEPDAVGKLERAFAAGRGQENHRVEARALRGLALAEAMRGRWEEMTKRADRLIVVAEAAGLPEERAWGLRLMGEAQLGRGEMEAGRRTLRSAIEEAAKLGRPELQREALLLLAASYARGGRPADALEARQEAQAVLEEMAMKIDDDSLRARFLSRADAPASPPQDRASRRLSEPPAGVEPSRPERGLGVIYEISQAVNSILDPEELLETVMDLAVGQLRADRGMIILFDGPGGEMRARVARNMERETIDDALAYSRHVVREAAEGKPVLSLDAVSDARFKDFRSVRLHGIRSLLCVPLLLRGRVVGTVYLDSRRAGVAFDESGLRFLEVFASMAALALHNAREFDGLRRENRRLREEVQGRFSYGNIVGKSSRMQAVFDILSKVTDSMLPILIYGESGTGKELAARAIHFNGPRREARFCSENCAAISETLLESELFGHVKGAFTGADRNRQGLFEQAHGGTLFLDEIGDMSLAMQGKVLRAIQEGEIRPVGGKEPVKVDVRIVSATNRDLDRLLGEGKFREDLYYRLNVVKLTLPPLRDRKEDIPLLVDHFLAKTAQASGKGEKRVDVDALSLLLRYHWPGNVRELENEVGKLAVFSEGDVITVEDINRHHDLFNKLTDLEGESPLESIDEVERKQIIRALHETNGHRGKAAQLLGISRATIFRKIKQYGISS